MKNPAPCPKCRNSNAKRLFFTWWGGIIGALLSGYVQCQTCQARFYRRSVKSVIIASAVILVISSLIGFYFFNRYWIHRYDELITRQAGVYRLDGKLVWSVIYEETYFSAWKIGANEEVGLMQVTPAVAREWAKETGFREFEKQTAENVNEFLRDPERNIQIGCWYLEKLREKYRGFKAEEAMTLAAYNAGPSRVEEWSKTSENSSQMSEREFTGSIAIPSTRSYVTSILERYRQQK